MQCESHKVRHCLPKLMVICVCVSHSVSVCYKRQNNARAKQNSVAYSYIVITWTHKLLVVLFTLMRYIHTIRSYYLYSQGIQHTQYSVTKYINIYVITPLLYLFHTIDFSCFLTGSRAFFHSLSIFHDPFFYCSVNIWKHCLHFVFSVRYKSQINIDDNLWFDESLNILINKSPAKSLTANAIHKLAF